MSVSMIFREHIELMLSRTSRNTLALAVCGCSALWAVQANAQTRESTIDHLQQQIDALQQQVQALKQQDQQKQQQTESQASADSASADNGEQSDEGPTKKLNVGGGVVSEYQVTHTDKHRSGGNLILDYLDLNFDGQYGNLTYAVDYRWSDVNIADDQYLHKGYVDYAFGADKSQHVTGGLFQVPFGNLPLGYKSFWGSLGYYAGFDDNQAAGLGYRYEGNSWRFDLAALKNDDFGQSSLYGSNPFQGYQQTNGGVGRLGYTFALADDNSVDISIAGRGGKLETGGSDYNNIGDGTHWAGTLAADASLGKWTLLGQFVNYKYNVPDNRNYDGEALPTDSITIGNYGFANRMPAEGQLYSATVARNFPVDLGPIKNFRVYDDYGYLHSGVGNFTDDGYRVGDVQENILGLSMQAGPLELWADMISAKNGAMVFTGPNDGDWHHRFNLTAAYYFDGELIK